MSTKTQAQLLATDRAGKIAHRATRNIEQVQTMAEWTVYGVMAISYVHQAQYLYSIFHIVWGGGLNETTHAITSTIGALLIPIVFDIFAVICIKASSTVGLAKATQRWGLAFLVIPTSMSGYVNFRSSINLAVAIIYLMVVGLIPVVEFLKAKMNDVDYDAIDKVERRALAQGGDDAVAVETATGAADALPLDPMMALVVLVDGDIEKAKAFAEYDKMKPSDKQSWSRRFNNASTKWKAEMADPAAAIAATTSLAPVSPAGPRS